MAHLEDYIGQTCPNCQHTIHGKYCHYCGQKFYFDECTFSWSLKIWLQKKFDLIEGVAWNTAKAFLTKPGELSVAFIEGRRIRYADPVKFLIFMALVFTLVVQLNHVQIFSFNIAHEKESWQFNPKFGLQIAENCEVNTKDSKEIKDKFQTKIDKLEISVQNDPELSSQAKKNLFKAISSIASNNCYLHDKMMSSINYFLWFMAPFFGLVLWIFNRKHKGGFLVNLLHSFHLHAFLFFVSLLSVVGYLIFGKLTSQAVWMTLALVFIYTVLSMKHVYNRSWSKTIWKTIFLACLYFGVLIALFIAYWMLWIINGDKIIPSDVMPKVGYTILTVISVWFTYMFAMSRLQH